ncbi:hypothetical protein BDR07DRAFT_701801 [Suillus spraguei]|nr:hypothetical protein BDR07DRAFT_701801 [Suillus spraguei]
MLTARPTLPVFRTLSIAVARLDGCTVRVTCIVDGKGFLAGPAIPSIYTNSMIRHLHSTQSLRFRTRLTRYIHDFHLSSVPHLHYCRVPLHCIGQCNSVDVDTWAESLAGIQYVLHLARTGLTLSCGNLMKSSLDLFLFTSQLARSLGLRDSPRRNMCIWSSMSKLKSDFDAFERPNPSSNHVQIDLQIQLLTPLIQYCIPLDFPPTHKR